MKTKADPPGRGWFAVDGVQTGPRDLAQQVKGLDILRENASGSTVLDLGCAEGLVSQWLCDAGAAHADGVDYSTSRVAVGNGMTSDRVKLRVGDLNDPSLRPIPCWTYDIVLLLSVVHKLKRPEKMLDCAARCASRWLAVRAPSRVIDDVRSDRRTVPIVGRVLQNGFTLIEETHDPVWLGIFERCTWKKGLVE